MSNVKHSSASVEWYTPADIVDAAREVFGGSIDLDPASCEQANNTVKARRYLSGYGLEADWSGAASIFLNPPGGKLKGKSLPMLFWKKLMETDPFGEAIVICFSIEQLQTSQLTGHSMADYPFCIPRRRIPFNSPEGGKSQPSHANAIIYVPGYLDNTEQFVDNFSQFGTVIG